MLPELCSLLGTDIVRGQVSEHIFASRMEAVVFIILPLFRVARAVLNFGNTTRIFPSIQPRDALRPLGDERKYLMAYIH